MSDLFITGIGTDVGKTFIAAAFARTLGYDYWKPVQTGLRTDSDFIQKISPNTKIHEEAYRFENPVSPHEAARLENLSIDLQKIQRPPAKNNLVIEGAGGVLVPLNEKSTMADLIDALNIPVLIVLRHYLGSINHSLLTLQEARRRNWNVIGLVFNGEENPESEKAIINHGGISHFLRINQMNSINPQTLDSLGPSIKEFYAKI